MLVCCVNFHINLKPNSLRYLQSVDWIICQRCADLVINIEWEVT